MKNDLTTFEKNLLRAINVKHGKRYTHRNFMEWTNSKAQAEKNLEEGETIYEQFGLFVTIKENASK